MKPHIAVGYVGFAFEWFWRTSFSFTVRGTDGPVLSGISASYDPMWGGFALAMLGYFLLRRHLAPILRHRSVLSAAFATAVLASTAFYWGMDVGSAALSSGAIVFIDAASAFFCLAWWESLEPLGIRGATLVLLGCFALFCALSPTVASYTAAHPGTLALNLWGIGSLSLSMALLALVARHAPNSMQYGDGDARWRWKPVPRSTTAALFLIGAVYALSFTPLSSTGPVSGEVSELTLVGSVVGMALLAFTALPKPKAIPSAGIRYVVFPTMMVGLLLAASTADTELQRMAVVFIYGGFYHLSFYVVLVMLFVGRRSGIPSSVPGSYIEAALHLGVLAGTLVSSALNALTGFGTAALAGIAVVCFLVLFIAVFVLLPPSGDTTLWGLLEEVDREREQERARSRGCRRLAEERALTPREEQVAFMLAGGAKPSQIADELVLSVATVRTHVHRVYEKAGVHSGDELRALVALLGGQDAPEA